MYKNGAFFLAKCSEQTETECDANDGYTIAEPDDEDIYRKDQQRGKQSTNYGSFVVLNVIHNFSYVLSIIFLSISKASF